MCARLFYMKFCLTHPYVAICRRLAGHHYTQENFEQRRPRGVNSCLHGYQLSLVAPFVLHVVQLSMMVWTSFGPFYQSGFPDLARQTQCGFLCLRGFLTVQFQAASCGLLSYNLLASNGSPLLSLAGWLILICFGVAGTLLCLHLPVLCML